MRIEEKPQQTEIGLCRDRDLQYDAGVFDIVRTLKRRRAASWKSRRQQRLNRARRNDVGRTRPGWWTDAGTFDSLLHAGSLVAETGATNWR